MAYACESPSDLSGEADEAGLGAVVGQGGLCGLRPDEGPLACEGSDEEGEEDCVAGAVHAGRSIRHGWGGRTGGRQDGVKMGIRPESGREDVDVGGWARSETKRLHRAVVVDTIEAMEGMACRGKEVAMRVAIEVEKEAVGNLDGPKWHEVRVVVMGKEGLTVEQREELENHRCGMLMDADYRIPAYDGLTRVYELHDAEPEDVAKALDAWRRHREHVGDVHFAGLQAKLLREMMSVHTHRYGHP